MAEKNIQNTGTAGRLPEYDIAKGIGVLLVVIGHLPGLPFAPLVWIFSFHIPMYFFISGIFVRPENAEPFLRSLWKNVRGLLLPYCVFSGIFILLDALIQDPFTSPRLDFKFFLTGQGGYAILWFFFVLFFERLLLDIGKRLIKNRVLLSVVALLLVAVGFVLHRAFAFNSFKIATILYAFGFYYLGFLLGRTKKFEAMTAKKRWYLLPLYLILNLLGCFALVRLYGTTLDLNSATSFDIVLNYAVAFCGICMTLLISRLLAPTPLGKVFSYIGKNSLFFYPLLGYIPFKFLYVSQSLVVPLQVLSYAIAALVAVIVAEGFRMWKQRKSGQ